MDEKFLIANHLVPDNEVWVSPKTFENPFSKNVSEALNSSHNKPMPKLPTLAECQTEVQSRVWGGGFVGTSSNITEIVYNFISRQLSA